MNTAKALNKLSHTLLYTKPNHKQKKKLIVISPVRGNIKVGIGRLLLYYWDWTEENNI